MTRSFEFLIRFMMFVAISIDAMILIAVFRLRAIRADDERPYRVPGYPWMPALVVVSYLLILVLVTVTQPELALGGTSLVLGLVVAGVIWTKLRKPGQA